jgi:methionine--tRNA ligase beta chain
MITYEDYQKTDLRIGRILSAEKVPDTDKLLKLSVDFGETVTDETGAIHSKPRQIVSGIALYFPDLNTLIGKKCAFVANLEPRVIRGLESQGMILASSVKEGDKPAFSLLEVGQDIPAGTKVS